MFGSVEVIVFPKILQSVSDLLVVSGVITVQGTLSVEEEKEDPCKQYYRRAGPKCSGRQSRF